MKPLSMWMLGAALALTGTVRAQAPDDVADAQRVADAWLALVDAGQYARSWDETVPVFQGVVSKPKWEESLQTVRAPLGALVKRSVQGATYSAKLPGAPAGEYVVIRYRTDFANRSGATETVTPMRGADGKWRVSGYFIN